MLTFKQLQEPGTFSGKNQTKKQLIEKQIMKAAAEGELKIQNIQNRVSARSELRLVFIRRN